MKKYWILFGIIVLGLFLRFYHNLDISLWHDEAFSVLMLRYSWPEMIRRLALDVHPPMYYIALRFWNGLFGSSLGSLRGFSIFFGTLTIPAAYLFIKQAFKSEKMALVGAFLVCINPFELLFANQARMYTFGAFFTILAAYFLVRSLGFAKLQRETESLNMPDTPELKQEGIMKFWNYIAFAACVAVIILTHYYLLFTAAGFGLYGFIFLIFHHRTSIKEYLWYLGSWVLVFLCFLPWLKIFLFQYRQVGAGYWIPPINIWSIPGTLWTILLGIGHDNNNPLTQKLLVLVLLFSIFFIVQFLRKTQNWAKWLVFILALAPFLGAILFAVLAKLKGSSSSVYEERYFLYGGIFYTIALAGWLSEIKIKKLFTALLVIYTAVNVYAFFHYWEGLDIKNKPGMSGAAKFLGTNVQPGQLVFSATTFEFFNYQYYVANYFPIKSRPLLFTGGRNNISQISHFEGVALLTNQDLLPDLSKGANSQDTVWMIWTNGFGSSKPSVPLNWVQIDEQTFPEVRPYVGTNVYVTEYKVN